MTVLASRDDKMVSPKCSEDIARYYNANLIEHPSAGHDLTLDDPSWVTEQILLSAASFNNL
jgi:predicted alpha/beta hydrolase family esterase